MNKNDILLLSHFNFWANGRILTACEQLTAEEFKKAITPDPGWGSLRAILVHILDTEHGWRTALQNQPDTILDAADFGDVAALRIRWEDEQKAWLDYLDTLDDVQLDQHWQTTDGPTVWQTITHVITHGIQHRSEAAFVLTGYGHSPGELDFDRFLREHS